MGLFYNKNRKKDMTIEQQILDALRRAIAKAGGKPELAKQLGMYHSRINCFDNGSRKIGGMTVSTLEKLFPDLKMYFFREEWPVERGHNFQGAHLNGVQLGNSNRMENASLNLQERNGQEWDDSTRMLLDYWREMPMSRRFELLARLAELKEKQKENRQ